MPLNEIGKEWVAALRSGEYKQGIGKLHAIKKVDGKEQHEFCCLGVLSEILVKHFPDQVEAEAKRSSLSSEGSFVDYVVKGSAEPAYNYLNDNLCKLAGFKGGSNGTFVIPGSFDNHERLNESLASLNDRGTRFSEIASIIEENADQLF